VLEAGTAPGTVGVVSSVATIAGAGSISRYGILSTYILRSDRATATITARLTASSGLNAVLPLHGGTGAGDFSHFVELAIEGGVIKVFADGQATWVGGAVSARHANIDVETVAPFRRGGLASLVCRAFIDHCRERGLTPLWEADDANAASRTLAHTLGFRQIAAYSQLIPPHGSSIPLSRGHWVAEGGTGAHEGATVFRPTT